MKISVIGYSGSGKSTLAFEISKHNSAKVLYLDTVHWLPGWKERSIDEEIAIVKEFLHNNDSWVIDGNYSKVCHEQRMSESDLIVFMRFNRVSSLIRAVKRYFKYKGTARESMTPGCNEKIDFQFVKWILLTGRSKKYKDIYKNIINKYNDKTVIIKNQKQLDRFKIKMLNKDGLV